MAQPPIVIKKVSGHAAHHGGAWKVAYADFVTAMMALFIVLWLMNSSKQIQVAIGGYFKDPTGNSKKVGSAYTGSGENVSISKDNMSQLKDLLQNSMKQMTNFESLKNHIEMTITAEGLRIELLEGKGDTFFQSGVASPSDNGKEIMLKLAQEVGKLPNHVAVEGHTDSKPYTGARDYDNWELSADRANTARRVMQQNGLGAQQVSQIRGYADQRPRKGHDAQDPTNRRISVIVQYLDKPQ
jgi:chemotaxis protein MotB